MGGYTDEQLYHIIQFCVSFLLEKFSHERGLFRSTVSQTHVREMQLRISNDGLKVRDEVDPHILAEVIQTSLRGLISPLLHEVYQEIVSTEISETDYNINKSMVQKWMRLIPDNKYILFNELFKLLYQLSQLEESDSGVVQLAFAIAPTICRPLNQAYMSIRHMEDLKKIRPIVLFLIENYSSTFFPSKPAFSFQSTAFNARPMVKRVTPPPELALSSNFLNSMSISIALDDRMDESKSVEDSSAFAFVKPNLLVVIPSLQTAMDSPSRDADNESDKLSSPQAQPYTDADWKILHALVNLKVSNFMELDDEDTARFIQKEASEDTHHAVMQAWTARVASTINAPSPSKTDLSGVPVSPAHGSIVGLHKVNLQKSTARRSYRRKLVAECKSLRAQITSFEQEFMRMNSRQPKSQERGNMQLIYTKYRELKRDIRDAAATDLQRVVRGYFARRVLGFQIGGKSVSIPNRAISSSGTNKNVNQPVHLEGDHLVKYRELLEKKRDLKRKLKKFDEDFLAQHHRAPKKSDKEIIRPMYQNYHEIKNNLDALKKIVLQLNIPIPDDLREEFSVASAAVAPSTDSRPLSTYSTDADTDDSRLKNRGALTTDTEESDFTLGDSIGMIGSSGGITESNMEELQQEKKNLHAYLKVYERDFNRTHGRPVTKSEDILPVASEYQRYKELKNIIKDMKG